MVLGAFNLDPIKGVLAHMLTARDGTMPTGGASSGSSLSWGCRSNWSTRLETRGLRASLGFSQELAHRGGICLAGVVCLEVSTGFFVANEKNGDRTGGNDR